MSRHPVRFRNVLGVRTPPQPRPLPPELTLNFPARPLADAIRRRRAALALLAGLAELARLDALANSTTPSLPEESAPCRRLTCP